MFASIFQGLTSLLLAGAFFYAILVADCLRFRRRAQQVLIGLVFGVLVVSLSMTAYVLEPRGVRLNAIAGPLVFAGYLGGPLSGFLAGTIGAIFSLSKGGPVPVVGVFMQLAIPTVGMLVAYLRPPANWPMIPKRAIPPIIIGFLTLFIFPILYVGSSFPGGGGYLTAARSALIFMGVGILSIFVTWQILTYATRFAFDSARAAELSRRLDLTLRHSGMGMFERTVGESDVYFDAGMAAAYGLDIKPGMVPMSTWAALIHPDDLPTLQAEFAKADSGERERDRIDFRIIRTDGDVRYMRAHWVGGGLRDGKPTRVFGVQADLTDIRASERQHRETVDRIAVIAENLPGVMFQSDVTDRNNTKLLYVSPKCKEIWGYTDEEIYADRGIFARCHDPEDLPRFYKAMSQSVETGKKVTHRFRITARDGTVRWLDYHGASSTKNGRVLLESIVLDVTREVAVQEQVEKEREISYRAQKSESIGMLTGGVAHDFNNLLAVILGNLELLSDENDPEMKARLIGAATSATMRGADLTKSLLAFARKARLKPEVLHLNTVVSEAKNWMGRALPESVAVETSLLAGLWPIKVDRTSLESALLNLILNARDAMDNAGKLTIETSNVRIDQAYVDSRQEEVPPGRYVMLAVSDTGSGIKEEDIASIFEPFFTTKPQGLGSGLGLSMAFGFVRQSGGTIQVYSEVGEGTSFKLYFPVAEDADVKPAGTGRAPKPAVGTGKRILLAEDEDPVRETLVTILERAGYDVTPAMNGDHAFALFEADPTFDLLLTDIVMPGELQGTHLSRAVRAIRDDLPVVFMSGYASEATVHGNGLRPEDIRLMKPVQREDLFAALSNAVRRNPD